MEINKLIKYVFCLIFIMMQLSCFSQLQLGNKLNSKNIVQKQKILISPSQIQDGYIIENNNVIYSVCVNYNDEIYFISTEDPNFKHQELHVGSLFKEIKNVKIKQKINGWGYVIENDSDWKYVFRTSIIKNSSRITFFFKYDPKLKTDSIEKTEIRVRF